MSHKLLTEELNETPKKKSLFHLTMPKNLAGKFGFSFFIGSKEIFLGLSIGDVEIERIVRKKFIPIKKAKVNVFKFDSL